VDELAQRTLERATRTELWAAVRTAWIFATEDQFTEVLDQLVDAGALTTTTNRWITTEHGRGRLARLRGASD
jgi:hypothetical protein